MKQQIKNTRDPIEKREINNRLEEVQRSLSMETESREQAAQMRIRNFYKTGTGKMNPETFYCIKEKQTSREIHSLTVDGRNITDPEEIVQIMQNWYEDTAQHSTPQTTTLPEFLDQNKIILPQLTDEQKNDLAEEFTTDEVSDALKEAQEKSAPDPSGQNISFYKLLFMLTPALMTAAINQMVFIPGLIEDKKFAWVRNRKVCYIPKKPNPTTPHQITVH
jgi:hypothetical protein